MYILVLSSINWPNEGVEIAMLTRHMEEQPWPHHSLTFLNELRCVRCRSIRTHELHQEAQTFMLHAANLKASLAFSMRISSVVRLFKLHLNFSASRKGDDMRHHQALVATTQ